MFGLHGKVKGKKIKFSRNALFLNLFSHFLRKKGEENLLPFPLLFFIVFFSSPFSMAFENEKTIFVSNFFPSFVLYIAKHGLGVYTGKLLVTVIFG